MPAAYLEIVHRAQEPSEDLLDCRVLSILTRVEREELPAAEICEGEG